MEAFYPLEWFDDLITIKLNPQNRDLRLMMQTHCEEIKDQANVESLKIQSYIKSRVFSTSKIEQIELAVRQYHSSLIILYDSALLHLKHPSYSKGYLQNVINHVISKIDELISFIESWFSRYLSLEDRAPQSYLSAFQNEIKEKLPILRVTKIDGDNKVLDIVLDRFHRFSVIKLRSFNITFRGLLYKKEVLKNLHELKMDSNLQLDYTPLDTLLIYLNYNSKSYINHLTHTIAKRINKSEKTTDKIDQLSLSFKSFNQMLRKPDVKLNPNFQDLDLVMSNWFEQEIFYLEKKLHLSVLPLKEKPIVSPSINEEPMKKSKIMCMLSTDQMALILRASDDLRILKAKSMSQVFKTIVPYLSTPHKENLSYDSMRSKSYTAEERDKEVTIETLEKMIRKIKEY